MAATYTSTLPTDKDKVRFMIQDTVVSDAQLQDEEILAMIDMHGSYKSAAVACCEALAAKYAAEAESKKIGNLTVTFFNKSRKYLVLADRLKSQAYKFVIPYAGGISQNDKQINLDSDTVKPSFKRNMMNQNVPDEIE